METKSIKYITFHYYFTCETYKIKNIDEKGNILNQESINCNILDIEDAKKLLKAIGYEEIMKIGRASCRERV